MTMIDLHIHTNCSDGGYSIQQTIKNHYARSFRIISITDHNSVVSREQHDLIKKSWPDICFIHGIEMTVKYQQQYIHTLSYFKQLIPIEIENHIKDYLIADAIMLRRSEKKPSIFSHKHGVKDNIHEMIELIHHAGGICILAHPYIYKDFLDELIDLHDGIECIHPLNDIEFIDELIELAMTRKKYCSAGSDFHDHYLDMEKHIYFCSKYIEVLQPLVCYLTC